MAAARPEQLLQTLHFMSAGSLFKWMLGCRTPPAVTLKAEKACYFGNPLWTSDIITAVDPSLGNRNEWASLFYYYYFWHRQPHTCRCSADRGSLPRWQQRYSLLYNKHIFQTLQPSLASLRAGTRAKQCIISHRLTFNACIPHSQLSRTGASQSSSWFTLMQVHRSHSRSHWQESLK